MKKLTVNDYFNGIKKRDISILARAITLVESENPAHQKMASQLIKKILPLTGKAKRIGISGTPGVGKSTFIETFGKMLTQQKKSLAVLAVDPTSKISGGSILGDKTRMNELAIDPLAFIRPSPSGKTLGGVAAKTKEAILLCEAFGYEYILIETVGVGQSETTVSQMVDLFLMLLQPGAGDDLQGIKRGILELVDIVVVTKDDGENQKNIEKAKIDYEHALKILRHDDWIPPVLSSSVITKKGFADIQNVINDFFSSRKKQIEKKRRQQDVDWMWNIIEEELKSYFINSVSTKKIKATEESVLLRKKTPMEAAVTLLSKVIFKK